jgi:hypothetical protein
MRVRPGRLVRLGSAYRADLDLDLDVGFWFGQETDGCVDPLL